MQFLQVSEVEFVNSQHIVQLKVERAGNEIRFVHLALANGEMLPVRCPYAQVLLETLVANHADIAQCP